MLLYTIKQYVYLIASIAAYLLPVVMGAVLFWANRESSKEKKWAVWSRANAWWLAVLAGVCAFHTQISTKPFTDNELRLQLAGTRQITYACSDWQDKYVYQYMQKPMHEVAQSRSWNTWELIDGLPKLPYTTENWRRMRPMLDQELDRFIDVMQDALKAFPDVLPLALRTRIVQARSQFEFDKTNYHVNFDLFDTQERKDGAFDGYVRGPIPEMKMVCGEAGNVVSRWRLTRINTHIGTPSGSE